MQLLLVNMLVAEHISLQYYFNFANNHVISMHTRFLGHPQAQDSLRRKVLLLPDLFQVRHHYHSA
jgi:hypothetical protein